MIKRGAFLIVFYLFVQHIQAQLIADGLPGCLDPTLFKEGTLFCGGGSSSVFDLVGTEFVVNNVDGIVCCGPPNQGGDNGAYFQFGPLDISSYNNVSILMDYTADPTGYEDEFPGAPSFGCSGSSTDNSHDQIVFTYIVDGVPTEDLYVHGTSAADFTGTWDSGPVINGNTLIIKVFAANKASAETFRFSNLQVFTSPLTIDAGPDKVACAGQDVMLMGSGVGEWSGGLGTFSDVTDPTSTYTPDASEDGTTVTLTFSAPPVTPECGLTINGPSDDMEITVSSPTGTLMGGGNLCPGECASVNVVFADGQAPYILDLQFNSSAIPSGFGFSIPGFDVNETIEICYGETGLFPSFDLATNTLTLPPIVANTSGDLTLVSLSDDNGCLNVPQNSTINFTFLEKPIAQSAMMKECNDGTGVAVFDFTTLSITILNGNTGTVNFYDDNTLNTEIFPPYIGNTTTIFATVTNTDGCISDPVPVDLIMIENGDAGLVTMTCMGDLNCTICDSDGLVGETVFLDFTFEDPSIDYEIEMVYFINGVQSSYIGTISGTGGSLSFIIDGDASFQVISVTPDGDCIDVTDMPPAVNFLYIIQPEIFPLGPFSDCDPIALPDINALNSTGTSFYNTEADGSGTSYFAGDVISNSITLYAIDGVLPNCVDVQQIDIVIEGSVNLIPPPNDTLCGYYIFPQIPGQGMGTTVSYYTEPGGTGTNYNPGDTLFESDVIYLYDMFASCPTNEPTFDVTITSSISFDTLESINSCDMVILPNITGEGLTDSVRYYSAPMGMGNAFFPGDTILISDTLFLFDPEIDCDQDSLTLEILIGEGITYDDPGTISNCGPFELPDITGSNLGMNAMYFDNPNGNGTGYLPGDTIYSTNTLYIFDTTTVCNINQPSFTITINERVEFDISPYIVSCGTYTLPAITGINLDGNEGYFTDKFGTGTSIPVGTEFNSDTIIYLYSGPDFCEVNKEIRLVFEEFNPGMANNYTVCSSSGSINLFDGLLPPYTQGGEWTEQGSSIFTISDPTNVNIPIDITSGTYRFAYTLSSPDCPTLQTVSRVEIVATPDAGRDTIITTCDVIQPLDLSEINDADGQNTSYEYLGSESVIFVGEFVDISGLSEGSHQIMVTSINLSVDGMVQCSDTAFIDIEISEKPSAGMDVNAMTCRNDVVDLNTLLVDNDEMGTFILESDPGALVGASFDPSLTNNSSAEILHITSGNSGCEPDTAIISIDIVDSPFAGDDVNTAECGAGSYELTTYLSNADPGGVFELESPSGSFTINGNNLEVSSDGTANINYIVTSASMCGNDTANLVIVFGSQIATNFTDSTCDAEYTIDGNVFTPSNNTGELMYTTLDGCDSIVNVSIAFNSATSSSVEPSICSGDSIEVNGTVYKEGNLSGIDTLYGMAASGCDSILFIEVNVEQSALFDLNLSSCNQDFSITIGSDIYDINNLSGISTIPNGALNGCDSIVNVNLQIEPFGIDFTEVDPACEEDNGFVVIDNIYGANEITFSTQDNDFTITDVDLPFPIELNSGNYTFNYSTTDEACSDMIDVTIGEVILPEAAILAVPISDSTWQLSLETDAVVTTYFWTSLTGTLSCWDCPNPIFTGEGDVTLIYDYGVSCTSNESITLMTERNNDFFFPNVISGDNNGVNDHFQIFINNNNNLIISSFAVFDRWGNKMTEFQSIAPQNGDILWDGKFNGKNVNPGVYVYLLQYLEDGKAKNLKGEITVIR